MTVGDFLQEITIRNLSDLTPSQRALFEDGLDTCNNSMLCAYEDARDVWMERSAEARNVGTEAVKNFIIEEKLERAAPDEE